MNFPENVFFTCQRINSVTCWITTELCLIRIDSQSIRKPDRRRDVQDEDEGLAECQGSIGHQFANRGLLHQDQINPLLLLRLRHLWFTGVALSFELISRLWQW